MARPLCRKTQQLQISTFLCHLTVPECQVVKGRDLAICQPTRKVFFLPQLLLVSKSGLGDTQGLNHQGIKVLYDSVTAEENQLHPSAGTNV